MQDENDVEFEMPDNDISDFDDVLSEISPDEDHDEGDESHDHDESGEDDSPHETVSQQTKKPSRWKRKVSYLTEQKLQAEQLAREREMVLAQKMAELETKDKFIASLFQSVNEPQQANSNFTQQDTSGATASLQKAFSLEDVERITEEKARKILTENARQHAQNEKLASKWRPQLTRIEKELSKEPEKAYAFAKWFEEYTEDVDNNPEKRTLLAVAGGLEFAAETLYTVGKSKQFKNLAFEDKVTAMLKLHADIASKRKNKTGTGRSIERPKSGGGTPNRNWREQSVEDYVKQKLSGN